MSSFSPALPMLSCVMQPVASAARTDKAMNNWDFMSFNCGDAGGNQVGGVLQTQGFFGGVFVLATSADAERANYDSVVVRWHAQRTADTGLSRAGFGHAAGICLQIANRDWLIL